MLRSFFLPICITCLAVSLTSCLQDKLDSPNLPLDSPSIEVQSIILEHNFRLEVGQMTERQIQVKYQELIQVLPEEDREGLVQMIEQTLAAQIPTSDQSFVASKKSESILSNGVMGDGFGQGVATVGNKVYVGSQHTQEVFEYQKTGGTYSLKNTITPSVPTKSFGHHVEVSGSWMAVAAPEFGPPYPSGAGKVFLFKKQGNSWVEQTILTGPASERNFGGDGIGLEGNQLVATSRPVVFPSPGGTMSIFNQTGNSWNLTGSIHKPGYDWFGIDMDHSGNRIVGTGSVNSNLGIVRATIFVKSGGSWVEEDEVIVPSPVPFAIALPRDVAIENDQVVLTAIVPGTKHWVLSNNNGDWVIEQEINTPPSDFFTNRWAEIQGSRILIGAAARTDFFSDAVHIFEHSGSNYALSETLTASDNGAGVLMWGLAVDGNTIVAGCPGFLSPGKVYVFD